MILSMVYDSDTLDEVLALIRRMEVALLGMEHLRNNAKLQELDPLIQEMETNLAALKKRLVQ